ncbi:DUF2254 domain-containing protein [Sphingomonas koreensis]|nr:DUF2254 domain-containing protein [Sphingomonas koreensis]
MTRPKSAAKRPKLVENVRELATFLWLPLTIVVLFLALAIGMYLLDAHLTKTTIKHSPSLSLLEDLFGDRGATQDVLSTLASGLLTITSIIFSLLLLAVQQGAAAFSNQVFDQFMRRRANQVYFGYFVGLSLYTLLSLATTNATHHPLIAVIVAIILTIVALCAMLVLIHSTLGQIRGTNVIGEIERLTLAACADHDKLLSRTRRTPSRQFANHREVVSDRQGSVGKIEIGKLEQALEQNGAERVEVALAVTQGSHVARGATLASILYEDDVSSEVLDAIGDAINGAYRLGANPDISKSPALGVEQLATIGWTSASSARSNPHPAIAVCRALHDVIFEWSDGDRPSCEDSRVIYTDSLVASALDGLESIAIAAAEAMQHQTLAEVYQTYASLAEKLTTDDRKLLVSSIGLSLAALRKHIPTLRLNKALETLRGRLTSLEPSLARQLDEILRKETDLMGFNPD